MIRRLLLAVLIFVPLSFFASAGHSATAQTIVPGSQLPLATPSPASDVVFGIHGGTLGVGGTTSKFLVSALSTAPCGSNAIVLTCPPYNATGNGTTDDTAAVQLAFTTASLTGATVYSLSNFTYAVSSSILDTAAPTICLGGPSNTAAIYSSGCTFKWIGASGGTIFIVAPATGQSYTQRVNMENVGFDGNSFLAATCLSFGGSDSTLERISVLNCSKDGLYMASAVSAPTTLHNTVTNFECNIPNGNGACVHLGDNANSRSTTQDNFTNLHIAYGGKERGFLFDFVDQSNIFGIQTFVYSSPQALTTAAYTASTSTTTLAVPTANLVADTAMVINGGGFQAYLYVISITDSGHATVQWASGNNLGGVFPSGSFTYEVNDGIAFSGNSSTGNNYVVSTTGSLVHAFTPSAVPALNTLVNIDHQDNNIPAPIIDTNARLSYSVDEGPRANGVDLSHITCDTLTNCHQQLYSPTYYGYATPGPTTGEFNVNLNGDNVRYSNGNDVASIAMPNTGTGNHQLVLSCITTNCKTVASPQCLTPGNGSVIGVAEVCSGTGVPSFSAPNGSTYMRYDGGTGTRFYVNTSGASTSGTTWTAQF